MGYDKEWKTENDYNTEGYGNIHAANTVAWAHSKWGNSRAERSEERDRCVPKVEVLLKQELCKVHKHQDGLCSCPLVLFTQPLRSGRIWHKVSF